MLILKCAADGYRVYPTSFLIKGNEGCPEEERVYARWGSAFQNEPDKGGERASRQPL